MFEIKNEKKCFTDQATRKRDSWLVRERGALRVFFNFHSQNREQEGYVRSYL